MVHQMRSLILLLLVGLSTSDEVVVNLDGPASKANSAAAASVVSHSCSDGTAFTCKPNSAHCFNDSPVYCNFSVDLVKEIMDKQDTEIESLTKRLEGLEKQHKTASATATKLREKIQIELKKSSKRVFLMEPKVLKGYYMATDNAVLLVAIFASAGVAFGVLGGSFLFKS